MFILTVLGAKEVEMRIIGCDLRARQQTMAMLDTATEEIMKRTLTHEGVTNEPAEDGQLLIIRN